MKRFLVLLIAISALSYGVSFSRAIRPGIDNVAAAGSTSTPTVPSTALPPVFPTATLPPVFPTATPPPVFATSTPLPLNQPFDISKPKLVAFIRVPPENVPNPYVILSGYSTFSTDNGSITINGNLQDKSFSCPSTPCALVFPQNGQVSFRAQDQSGNTSDVVQANISVTKSGNGYSVKIVSLQNFIVFSDSCANIWQNAEPIPPSWASYYQDPAELDTQKNLYNLAARILTSGIVSSADCPNGGYENNAPNACALEKAKDQMIAWQNQYDLNIWLVSRDEHIPPIILKTLLEVETQFWPISNRLALGNVPSQKLLLDELGLGQINQLGIDVLLRTNPGLYQQVCTSALYSCDKPYDSLPGIDRELIRGTLIQSLDTTCPTCTYGINLNKASQSIPLIAKVLYANCVQAKAILKLNGVTANYEDSWKFTMVSYHNGFGCLQNAIAKTAVTPGGQIDWKSVAPNLACGGSADYVDKFWTALQTFGNYRKSLGGLTFVSVQSPPPAATQVVVYSHARILVQTFFDQNGDGIQQPNEALDNVQVNLEMENGATFTQISKNGMVIFDLQSISIGAKGKINLPGLYRSASIQVPASGDVPVIFIFTRPILPTQLP